MNASPAYFANDNIEALEQERLRCLGELLNRTTEHRLAQLPIAAGWNCLEVGAGEGSVARSLASRVGREGRVVATDINPRFLSDSASPNSASPNSASPNSASPNSASPNIEVRRHDILQDELETGCYDLVHCRMLLMHLPDPVGAVRRMSEALRPGGWILIEEGDMISLGPADASHPRSANFARVTRAISDAVTATKLVDSYFGRRVRSLVEQFGFAGVDHEGRVPVSRGGEPGARFFQLSSELVGPKLIAAGILEGDQFADHHAAYDDPTFTFIGMTNFAAWGRKT